jgi:RimJ/RimL family protein N-acetyltransferase
MMLPEIAIRKIDIEDTEFILALLNSEGWLRWIGDRNVKDLDAAAAYIRAILEKPQLNIWVIEVGNQAVPAGIITLIKRDYLSVVDLGFALLPDYEGNGIAYHASKLVIAQLIQSGEHDELLAITLPENKQSIHLLHKLGFVFKEHLENEGEGLSVYILTL